MLIPISDAFVGMMESESDPQIHGVPIDSDVNDEVTALRIEIDAMHVRMIQIQNRLQTLELTTARAKIERFDISTNIERMKILDEDCQTRMRLINSRNLTHPSLPLVPQTDYADSHEGDDESIYDPDERYGVTTDNHEGDDDDSLYPDEYYGVNSPRFSLSDVDINVGYDAELQRRLDGNNVSDSERTQMARWSDVESDPGVEVTEQKEQKLDVYVQRLSIQDVSLDKLPHDTYVMVTKRGVIHHVDCNTVRNRSQCRYMSVDQTLQDNRLRLPTTCCRRKFLSLLDQ